MGKYEVTQEQWVAIMGENPSEFQARRKPVEDVSWDDVQEFIRKLNKKEGVDRYRLPTEAEWEYAARAGSEGAYCYGDDPDARSLRKYAWYKKLPKKWYDDKLLKSFRRTIMVGELEPNAWGLFDMHGNVWEWCQDWFDHDYYASRPSKDPKGPSSGRERVLRGGAYNEEAGQCRSAARYYRDPDKGKCNFGFRLVLFVERK